MTFSERLLKIIPTLQSIIPVSLDYTNLGSIGIRSFSNNITFIEPEYEKIGMIQLQFLLDLPEDILYEDYFNVLGIINSNLNGNNFYYRVNVEVDEKRITIYLNNNEESNSLTQTDNLQLRHNFDQLLGNNNLITSIFDQLISIDKLIPTWLIKGLVNNKLNFDNSFIVLIKKEKQNIFDINGNEIPNLFVYSYKQIDIYDGFSITNNNDNITTNLSGIHSNLPSCYLDIVEIVENEDSSIYIKPKNFKFFGNEYNFIYEINIVFNDVISNNNINSFQNIINNDRFRVDDGYYIIDIDTENNILTIRWSGGVNLPIQLINNPDGDLDLLLFNSSFYKQNFTISIKMININPDII